MKQKILLATLAMAFSLSGCVVAPAPYYGEPLRMAPPPTRMEYPGPAPALGHIWIEGYWNWSNVRYVWVPGHWEAHRPGYVYQPRRWVRNGDRWQLQGGRWEHDHRPVTLPPRPIQPPHLDRAPPRPHPESAPRLQQEPSRLAPIAPRPVNPTRIEKKPEPHHETVPRQERIPSQRFEREPRAGTAPVAAPRSSQEVSPRRGEREDRNRSDKDERRQPESVQN